MKYIKIISRYSTDLTGIAQVIDNYEITKGCSEMMILGVSHQVWYSDDTIKFFNRDFIRLEIKSFDHIEEISYRKYNSIIKQLKERRIIDKVKTPEEPYMIDVEHSTSTLIKAVPKPGFERGKRMYHTLEYFHTLGAAYPVEHWQWFENEPYDIKVDTKKYYGYKFVPEESTIEKSVYKIIWPRKRDFEKAELIWR